MMAAGERFERSYADPESAVLLYPAKFIFQLLFKAAGERFERSYTDPESAVLPLDDPAKNPARNLHFQILSDGDYAGNYANSNTG